MGHIFIFLFFIAALLLASGAACAVFVLVAIGLLIAFVRHLRRR